jgi:phosphatidylserine/phosphatidylglycerophosphate/cardiolipin synthase-like enzyme
MDSIATHGVLGANVYSVYDGGYFDITRFLIQGANERCYTNVFIVDPTPGRDPNLRVDDLLRQLRLAHLRGVDVRLIIGGSRKNASIAEATLMAYGRARQLRIPAKLLALRRKRSSHSKIFIADDSLLIGSHNWSGGAFGEGQTQDSVVVESDGLAAYLAAQFCALWASITETANA